MAVERQGIFELNAQSLAEAAAREETLLWQNKESRHRRALLKGQRCMAGCPTGDGGDAAPPDA
jgi:hypothetical protein